MTNRIMWSFKRRHTINAAATGKAGVKAKAKFKGRSKATTTSDIHSRNSTLPGGDGLLSVTAYTNKGTVREINQDSVGVVCDDDQRSACLIVADGMGGHEHGEYASRLVVEELAVAYQKGKLGTEVAVQKTLDRTNSTIKKKYENCGTTCVMMVVEPDGVRVANIGDSRAYLLRGGCLRQLTRDDSLVQDLLDKKRVTEEQAAVHPKRNVLTKALGRGKKSDATFSYAALVEGDVFMLCTDGVYGSVNDEQIVELLSWDGPLETIAESLAQLALTQGSTDNVSVALTRYWME